MNLHPIMPRETGQTLFFLALTLLAGLLSMGLRAGPELADDGAFFLRYAENMVQGEFWVWNLAEAPVWGASAPLYPLVVAIPLALGISPMPSIIGTGMVLMSLAICVSALAIRARFGMLAAVAFVAFVTFDSGLMYFAGSGLESPLTVLLLALALWAVLGSAGASAVGLIAGLLMIQKLDLVPTGGLLLLAIWLRDGRLPVRAAVTAGLVAATWYVFAWVYFGAPVPNSFLTKALYQNDLPKIIDWKWFGGYVLLHGLQKWLVLLALVAAFLGRRPILPAILVLGGTVVTHLIAYTIKYPFEPYTWYCIPSVFCLAMLAAIGIGLISARLKERGRLVAVVAPGVAVILTLIASYRAEKAETEMGVMFTSHHEFDRAEAGRWVAANTPQEFKVFTSWGNPAYFSRRFVYDGSFLNRRLEDGSLVDKYRPEILILQANPGVLPSDPVFPAVDGKGYEVVRVFDKTHAAGMDYFFAVLARSDVVDKISGRESPVNVGRFLQNPVLGDQFGLFKPQGRQFFVHPGATTPTQFEFDAAAFFKETGRKAFRIDASMASNVPEEAVKRGAANVKLIITADGKPIGEAVVKVGQPFAARFEASDGNRYRIVVDNNGGADTDWLLLSIR